VIGKIAGLSGALVSFLTAMLVAAHGFKLRRTRQPISKVEESPLRPQAFHTDWLSILVGWLMFCTCLVSMATLKSICRLSQHFASHSSLVDYPCSFSGLAFVNFRGMQESSALNIFLHGWKFLLSSSFWSRPCFHGGGAGNPTVSLGSSQQAMGWTGVFQGAALAFYAFIGFEDIVNV